MAPPTDAAMFRKLGGREFEFEFSGTSSEADPKFIDRRDERMDGDMEEFVVGFIVGGAIIYSKTCALKRRVGDFGKIQKNTKATFICFYQLTITVRIIHVLHQPLTFHILKRGSYKRIGIQREG